MLHWLARRHAVTLAVGRRDGTAPPPCALEQVDGLDARDDAPLPLDSLAARVRPDVIHLHNVVNPRALRWARGRPALATVQDHRAFCPGRGKWTGRGGRCDRPMHDDRCRDCLGDAAYAARLLERTRRRRDALRGLSVVVLSAYMRDELIAVGIDARRVTVIQPFVDDLDTTAAPTVEPHVLFCGRLVAAKGVDDAVAAWRASGVELPLRFAGTGAARGDLQRAGHLVSGWLDRRQLAGVYRSAAALVLPSRWAEPFGIVGLEALACGVPVAAWESGGVAEWHPGDPPLARWGDVDGLAASLRAAIGRRGALPAGYDRDGLMRRLEATYARVVADG